MGFPDDECVVRSRTAPGVLLDTGDLVVLCHNTGDLFAFNVRDAGGWRRLIGGFSDPYFADLTGSFQAISFGNRQRSMMITAVGGKLRIEELCRDPASGCPPRLANLFRQHWRTVEKGNVYGYDYRDRAYRVEVSLTTGLWRENVGKDPGVRTFDRGTAQRLFDRYDGSVWSGRVGGRPAVAVVPPGAAYRPVQLDLPADARLSGDDPGPIFGSPVSADGCAVLVPFEMAGRPYGLPTRRYLGLFDTRTGALIHLVYSGEDYLLKAGFAGRGVLAVSRNGAGLVERIGSSYCAART